MLKIVSVPNKVLFLPTSKVGKIDKKIKKLVEEMGKTLVIQDDPPGVGLAANQVGVPLSLFIIKPTLKSKIEVFINPQVIETVFDKQIKTKTKKKHPVKLEGCLSIPRIWGPVKRANKVYLEYQDLTGKIFKKWFTGFEAVIIQHEMDHLNGIVFTQRSMEQKKTIFKEEDGDLKAIEL